MNRDTLRHKLFSVPPATFESLALEIFLYQYENVSVYTEFVKLLSVNPNDVKDINSIPFLPIEFFKTHRIGATKREAQKLFESSATTSTITSRHYVTDIALYEESISRGFDLFFGKPEQYCIIGLLPSYLERNNSSLVYMMDYLIKRSAHPLSGFYLNDYRKLNDTLNTLEQQNQETILLGVTFALLDFAEEFPQTLKNTIIMETGGMKGRREEIAREELHAVLCNAFKVEHIYSEYGMTELLSQAYSKGNGIFQTPPWMRVFTRDVNDPFELSTTVQSGAINIIDLANLDSCSFIATSDLGKCLPDGTFEVLGRLDYSDIRGCNLLMQ